MKFYINKLSAFFIILFIINACSKKGSTPTIPTVPTATSEVSINANETYQTIQGFGCATVFAPPNTTAYTSDEFDRLFGNGDGKIGLSILRIRVATDDAWRATELNYAKWAIKNGAKVFATPWSPPPSMKTNNSLIGGSLITDSGAAYAKYLNNFANYMAANGVPLHAISVQNEPDYNPTYEGCVWTANAMRDFIKNHGNLITATKLMAPELVNNNQTYVNTILSDNGAANNLKIIGTHLYGGGIVENALAKSLNKEVWMTEHLDTTTFFTSNINTAVEIHNCFTKANFSAYIWWYGKRFYGPIGQDGAITTRGYIMSHFARYIPSGSVRIGVGANTRSDVLISAYTNGSKKIIIAINTGVNNVTQKISLQNGTLNDVIPITTNSTKNMAQAAKVTSTNNSFTYLLPTNSITTFIEQ